MQLFDVTVTDFGPYESFKLDLYKQGLIWVGGENRDTKSAMSNGSGKTHLLKSIPWCLWGKSIDRKTGDEVIRNGTKCAAVSVRLGDDDSALWTVTRERRKGAPKLKLVQPDGEDFVGSKDDIQAKINEMIGLDWLAFKNTVLYGQNDSARFADPKTHDSERKQMLHKIMRTEILERCHEHAKIGAKAVRDEIAGVQAERRSLEDRVVVYDIDDLQREFDLWEKNRNSMVENNLDSAKFYKQKAQNELDSIKSEPEQDVDIEALRAELETLKKGVDQARAAHVKVKSDEQELFKAMKNTADLDAAKGKFKTKLENFQYQLDQLKGSECPVCTSPLDEGVAHEHIGTIKEKIAAVETKLVQADELEVEFDQERSEAYNKHDAAKTEADKLWPLSEKIDEINESIADAEGAEAIHQTEIQSSRERAKGWLNQARQQVQMAEDKKAEENPHVIRLEKAQALVKEYRLKINASTKAIDKLSEDLAHHEFWVRGFSDQGLPSFLLDSVMPYITERANHYLETLADGDITMEFSTQRELKSSRGEMRDQIDIQWNVEGLDSSYPPSGGQLKKMEIATDLALMDLVATREGGSIDLLMLDEVLDGLDTEGCQRVLMLLQNLRAVRGTIFVISHQSEVAEIFEKSITTIKEGGVASIQIAA